MTDKSFRVSFSVAQEPEAAYAAICNPRAWWSEEIEGETNRLNAVFYYHYKDIHRATFKITELEPGKRVVWRVLHNNFNFIRDQREWVGTDVIFDISRQDGKTHVEFTHAGLMPADECYDICSEAWGTYIRGSLRGLIAEGKGQPNPIAHLVARVREMSDAL